jgi:hypothetical protein
LTALPMGCREHIIGDTHGVIPFRRVRPDTSLPSDAAISSRGRSDS